MRGWMFAALVMAGVGLTSSAGAHEDDAEALPPGYRIDVSDTTPAPGEDAWIRLAWENESNIVMGVPSDLWKRAKLHTNHCPVSGCRQKHGYAIAKIALKPTPPSEFEWTMLAPETALERHVSLSELFPKRCKGGCQSGRYVVTVVLSLPDIGPRAKNQASPGSFVHTLTFVVAPRQIPVRSPSAISVKARYARKPTSKGELPVAITVRNELPFPMYFPKPPVLFIECDLRFVGVPLLRGGAGSSGRTWDESDAVLLAPGKEQTFKRTCPAEHWSKAKAVYGKLRVMIPSWWRFRSARGKAVHYFDGEVTTPEVKLR